jgi:general secretion pathway protein E
MQANDTTSMAMSELKVAASEYGIDCVTSVEDCDFAPEMLEQLPVEWARENAMLPLRVSGRDCLLISDPAAIDKQEYVSILVGVELHPLLAPKQLVLSCIERCYFKQDNSPSTFIDDLEEQSDGISVGRREVNDLLQVTSEAPVTQLINLILLDAYKQNASDIHIEPFENRLRVRYRIDGVLYEQSSPPANMVQPLVSRLKVMAHMDIAERRLPQDGMARVSVGEHEIDIRVSTVPVTEGERVVLRLLDKSNTLLSMADLGMEEKCGRSFSKLLNCSNGIIIVSGPTGSGKTTTLYAALGELNSTRSNILTIEDPIEYQLDNVGQIQVKPKIGLTFSSGLRHILRQDPDVILVGETRDTETAEIAIRAALTGHLVFTTLHTNDAPSAIVRLTDMGIAPYLIASSLRGILAQRLVRKLCVYCNAPHEVTDADLKSYGAAGAALAGKSVRGAVGCEHCTDGYRGRLGIFELLTITPKLRDIVRESKCNLSGLRLAAAEESFDSLIADGISKVLNGITTMDEILGSTSV